MNANELADELNGFLKEQEQLPWGTKHVYLDQASAMLRQQQAEIEALKLQLHTTLTNRDLRTYDGKLDMNNEPVAWRRMEENGWHVYYETECWGDLIPLYTHPAKTLTDEEILEIWNQHSKYGAVISVYDFAKAILRKAQEK